MQLPLIKPKLKAWVAADTGTADARYIGITEYNLEWMLKMQREHAHLPISEFLCYRVFEACGQQLPVFAVLEDAVQGDVFGSRWQGGVKSISGLLPTQSFQALVDNAASMSACLALDLLLANSDRHFGNFLFVENRLGRHGFLVMDFSRAFLINGWPPADIWNGTCNTVLAIQALRSMNLWSPQSAVLALSTAQSLPHARWRAWVEEAPASWLAEPLRTEVEAWWHSDSFLRRLRACIEVCQ